jgi:hypothetical protein
MTTTDTGTAAPAPLEMARNWAELAGRIAEHYEQKERADPGFGRAQARVDGAGRQQFEAAQMASFMALVSIAEDARRIADHLTAQRPGIPVETDL